MSLPLGTNLLSRGSENGKRTCLDVPNFSCATIDDTQLGDESRDAAFDHFDRVHRLVDVAEVVERLGRRLDDVANGCQRRR